MADKIKNLPENSQEILKIGSCIGNYFNLDILEEVTGKPQKEITNSLTNALQEGIIDRIDTIIYRFNHDRVMDAAYSMISEKEKIQLHYTIGNHVLTSTSEYNLDQKIFYIANHLNKASELISDKSEKINLCKLNLRAGVKAFSSGAYEKSFIYLKKGINLLDKNSWKRDYELTLDLYSEATSAITV